MTEGREFKPGVPLRPERVSVELPVRYRPAGSESWYIGRSENLSRVGLLMRVVHPLPLQARVEVTMTVPAGLVPGLSGELVFSGTVARHVPAGGGPVRLGIAFEGVRPAGAG
jgi:PilZ domain